LLRPSAWYYGATLGRDGLLDSPEFNFPNWLLNGIPFPFDRSIGGMPVCVH
jgi:hypothetical protein